MSRPSPSTPLLIAGGILLGAFLSSGFPALRSSGGSQGLPASAHAPLLSGADPAYPSGGPAQGLPGFGRLTVASDDPSLVPNDGLMANLTGFRVPDFPGNSSFQLGAEEVLGNYLVTFGLFQNSPLGPYPFFSVFVNATAAPVWQATDTNTLVTPGDGYDFALRHGAGTNWTLSLNGVPFGDSPARATFDFGVADAQGYSTIGLSMTALSSGLVVPESVDLPTAVGVHTSAGWRLPGFANQTYIGDPSLRWGVSGRLQSASLYPGEIVFGTAVALPPQGARLWDSAPLSVQLALRADPTQVAGTGTALLAGSARSSVGVPLAGFPLALSDGAGGTLSEPRPQTDANGSIREAFVAPNVTAAGPDILVLVPRTLGATGSATASLALTPAVELLIAIAPGGTLLPGRTYALSLRATDPAGSPVASVAISLYSLGGGTVTPGSAQTDPSGGLNFSVTAPTSPGTIRVFAVASAGGYWGRAVIELPVHAPPAPLWSVVAPWLVLAALVAGVALLGRFLWRRRPPLQPLPPMTLRRPRARPAPPPIRTPPSGGNP